MSHRIIKTVALIHLENRKILLSRNKGKLGFYMLGGKIEPNETERDALQREIKEELAVVLVSDSIKKYGVFEAQAYGEDQGIRVSISCYTATFLGDFSLSGEIDEVRFFTYDSYLEMSEQAPAVKLILKQLYDDGLLD